MKRYSFVCAAVLTADILGSAFLGAAEAPSPIAVTQTKRYQFPNTEYQQSYAISNAFWNYEICFLTTKNTEKTPPVFQMQSMARPFPRILDLKVNGISSRNVLFDRQSLKTWNDPAGDRGGCEFTLNFNGAKVNVRVFMESKSRLLFVRVAPSPDTLEPIKEISVSTYAFINYIKTPGKGWDPGAYGREFVTSRQECRTPSNKGITLSPEETSILFRDSAFGKLPGYLLFERKNVLKTTFVNGVYQTVVFDLKPDFQEFTFGIWGSVKQDFTNQEFEKLLKDHPEEFKF